MTKHTLLNKFVICKCSKFPEQKYRPVLSSMILKNFGKPYYNTYKIKKILTYCVNHYSKEFENICKSETSFHFYNQIFRLNEMAAEFYRLSNPKNDFTEEITESYLAVYRRILKMILEQGCNVKMISEEKTNTKIQERFDEKFDNLLFLGQMLFDLSESYAEQEMIEDATDISFDQDSLYLISRRHHYEDAFQKILERPDRIISKGILNKTAEKDLNEALNKAFCLSYENVISLFAQGFFENKLNLGEVAIIAKNNLGEGLNKLFNVPIEKANHFFDGLTLSRVNKMHVKDLIQKPFNNNRFLYRPLLVWEIDGKEWVAFGIFSFQESWDSILHNAIPWGNAPKEWKTNQLFKKYTSQKEDEHEKWLNDVVEDEIKKCAVIYQPSVKKIQTKSGFFNIHNEICGEIDFLVINEKAKKIFILECKHLVGRYDMTSYRQDYSKFIKGRRPFNKTLERKINWIKNNLKSVEEHFQFREMCIDISFENYTIQGIFVINTPTFYMYNSDLRIYTYQDIGKVICDEYVDKMYSLYTVDDKTEGIQWIKYPYFKRKHMTFYNDPDWDCEVDKYGYPIKK